jgi:hypothetical protein
MGYLSFNTLLLEPQGKDDHAEKKESIKECII